jgi:hypothetical protein
MPKRVNGCLKRFWNSGSSFDRSAIKRRRWPIVCGHSGQTRCLLPLPVIRTRRLRVSRSWTRRDAASLARAPELYRNSNKT